MKRQFVAIAAAIFVAVVLSLSTGSRPVAAQSGQASEILQLVNQVRTSQGLAPFQFNSALAVAAQNQANWMAANLVFTSHVGAGGSTPQTRAAAAGYVGYVSENIVGGTGMSPRQGVIWWQNSPVHYNTIVSLRYSQAGTAYARNEEANVNTYVLVVGLPSDEPLPDNRREDSSAEPIFVTPIELSEPREDGSIVHVIQPGQALWTLSAYYDVELDYLMLINNLKPTDFVQPGDEIYIRLGEGQAPPPTATPRLTHIVQPGDTAWKIAAEYELTLDELLWYNNLGEDVVLQPGDEVIVHLAPGQSPPPTPTPPLTHVVKSGDTAWGIALRYGLTLDEFLALNGLSSDAVLSLGDELYIRTPPTPPAASQPPTQTPTPAAAGAEQSAALNIPTSAVVMSPQVVAAVPTHTPRAAAAGDGGEVAAAPAAEQEPETAGSPLLLIGSIGLVVLAGGVMLFARKQ